jgi:hypothetical protein
MPKGQNSFNPTKYPKKGSLIISKTKEQIWGHYPFFT